MGKISYTMHCGYLYNIFLAADNEQQDIAVLGIANNAY
jgi:hypothetical protein